MPPTAIVDRVLRVFGDVRPGEGAACALMAANVFVLLTAYYVLKTVREPLVLLSGTWGLEGDELKIYAAALQAVALVAILPLYGRLAARLSRLALVRVTLALFVASLGVFMLLGLAGVGIGFAFYLWLGVVALLGVAQFWSFANDLHDRESGERLFGVIAIGGSVGAIAGAQLARWAIGSLGVYALMAVAMGLYAASFALVSVIERLRDDGRTQRRVTAPAAPGPGSFRLVLRDRYLLLLAALLLLGNFVNTQGEFVLADAVKAHAEAAVADVAARRAIIGRIYGDFYTVVNAVALVVQALLVSRLFRRFGVRPMLFVLPAVALVAYGAIAFAPSLMVILTVKAAENSVDYSLHGTLRHALFLPTSREAKYKAKAVIDTSFVRFGDAAAAAVVFVGLHALRLDRVHFAVINVALVGLWLMVAAGIARRHRALVERSERLRLQGPRRLAGVREVPV